ncbi:MAG: hypothetical protein KF894_21570 [Labilithrix sp.]|nr:hypothetical protein [Labilithrix sp.]
MKTPSLYMNVALVLATAVCGITGCASPTDDVRVDEPSETLQMKQVPVDANKPTGIMFVYDGQPFIRVLATGDGLTPKSTFTPRTEYWVGSSAIRLSQVKSLEMVSSALRSEDAALSDFLHPSKSFGAPLTAPQVVSKSDWTEGAYEPTARLARLFKAADPDDPRHAIGLLVEQDTEGTLVATTWYKSVNTSRIFEQTPERLTFTQVTDARGRPSNDPRHIDAEATWFHFTAR